MIAPVGLVLALVIVVGLIVGSFLNVCIYRIPLKRSIVWPASRCASCERPLEWFENVPVLSYAALRGRCRTCGARISIRYPIVELATGAAFALDYLAFGVTPLFFVRALFACAMIVLFAIDFEHQLLPNAVTVPGIVIGFLASLFLPPGPVQSIAGIAVGGGLLWLIIELWLRLRGVEAMGFGDVKMLAMIGAFLGLKLTILTFILSSLMGGVIGLFVIVTRRGGMATALPYGTMLAVAAFIGSVAGERLIDWYVHLYL